MDFDTIMIIVGIGIFFAILFSPRVGGLLAVIVLLYVLSLAIPVTRAVEIGSDADAYCASIGGTHKLFHMEWDSAVGYYPNYCALHDGSVVRVPGQ